MNGTDRKGSRRGKEGGMGGERERERDGEGGGCHIGEGRSTKRGRAKETRRMTIESSVQRYSIVGDSGLEIGRQDHLYCLHRML